MKEELEKQLVLDFPNTFYRDDGGGQPYFMFGFECGDGWEPSIRKTAEKLEPLLKAAIKKDQEGFKFGYYRTSQLKEKYGTGRWYLSGATVEMWNIVSEWEKQTETICETCGKKGKLRGQGWFYISCYSCAKNEDRDNLEYLENEYNKNQGDK